MTRLDEVHSDFEAAFREGAVFRDGDGGEWVTTVLSLGALTVESKALAVGDPLGTLIPERPPCGCVAQGNLDVQVSLATCLRGSLDHVGRAWIAAARVRVFEGAATSWVPASHGAEVHSGLAAFADAGDPLTLPSRRARTLSSQLRALASDARAGADVRVQPSLIALTSGRGNGAYRGWWGIAINGKAAYYVLDFEVLLTDETRDTVIPWPKGRGDLRDESLARAQIRARVPWLSPKQLELQHPEGGRYYPRWRTAGGRLLFPRCKRTSSSSLSVSLDYEPHEAQLILCERVGQRPMVSLG